MFALKGTQVIELDYRIQTEMMNIAETYKKLPTTLVESEGL